MKTFYFTYGRGGTQDFDRGWTEVIAEDRDQAVNIFCMVHKRSEAGLVNCSSIYAEEDFKKTGMYKIGNFDTRCVERLSIERKLF